MAIRKIVYLDNPVLREKARKVREFDATLHELLDDMRETLLHAVGVGLAAPQVNVGQRVIVVHLPDDEESREEYGDLAGVWFEVVNPEVIRSSRDLVDGVEACLSIPGYAGQVERHRMVKVRGQDRKGKELTITAYDWLARVFQHEIDHLDGVLYIDRASEVWKAGEQPPSQREAAGSESAEPEDISLTEDPGS